MQKICDVYDIIVPYFKKNRLKDKKKKDFELWSKGVEIIYKNKGKSLVFWKKNDLNQLMQIQKSCAKYKNNPRSGKWLEMAKTLTKTN